MKKLLTIFICIGLCLAGCSAVPPEAPPSAVPTPSATKTAQVTPTAAPTQAAPTATVGPDYLIRLSIQSEVLEDNLAGTPAKRKLVVSLPPSYYDAEKSYPVVYYLHGFGELAGAYIADNDEALHAAFQNGAKEFIFVEVDGGSSFYVNSPVSGRWEDYVMSEVIPFIDETYRTLPKAESRGICGFSMGGFGALNLAMRHPDVFGAVYAMSPGLLTEDGLAEAMETWGYDSAFKASYARAFAPNPDAELLGDIPAMDGSEADNAVIEQWKNGFGNLPEKLNAYLALGTPLRGIGLCYGTKDNYGWIPKGTAYFSSLLEGKGIAHTLYTFTGSHTQPTDGMTEHLLPFFNETLIYE